MENTNHENARELNPDEFANTAGGDIIDDTFCFFGCHTWGTPISTKGNGNRPEIYFNCYKCKNCGKFKYTKQNMNTHEEKEISKEEFDRAAF